MPFDTVNAYQEAVIQALKSYQRDKFFKKNKHDSVAEELKKEIGKCGAKDEITRKLYDAYLNVLKKESVKLAKKIAMVLAQELGLSSNAVMNYHANRAKSSLTTFLESGSIIEELDFFSREKSFWDHLEGSLSKIKRTGGRLQCTSEKKHRMEDPIIICNHPIIKAINDIHYSANTTKEVELLEPTAWNRLGKANS